MTARLTASSKIAANAPRSRPIAQCAGSVISAAFMVRPCRRDPHHADADFRYAEHGPRHAVHRQHSKLLPTAGRRLDEHQIGPLSAAKACSSARLTAVCTGVASACSIRSISASRPRHSSAACRSTATLASLRWLCGVARLRAPQPLAYRHRIELLPTGKSFIKSADPATAG